MKKIIPILLQIPLLFVIISSFFAGIYAAITKIQGISFAVPIIMAIIITLYFYGRYLEKKSKKDW